MECMVQSLRGCVRTRYFGVIGETNQYSSYTDEAADAVDRALSEFTNTHLHISLTDDRLVSPFFRRMKGHEVIHERCTENIAAIIESVKFDAESEILKLVYPVVCCYWDIGQELIGTREYLFENVFVDGK
ncbi:hypothetical protein PC128_g26489 [Phytophthora cactorum]|nr:hypothetical protein PC128_g26489 [Phytophthora cactorum]